ncbi:transmembrane channel-like protein 7 [Actinia tenebrosa]|uniref:Transmembrane channel-like protein 7 n=1 Tax=Actinia tenebrosa TaxID=6105 RepID=A0A6P8HI50_ACTTE|nr:transmembrane channel-like protein 7 [Actinia tenebrosa]
MQQDEAGGESSNVKDSEREKEQNIMKSLPSRQIASWKLKIKKRKSELRKQKSYNGKMYMPVEDDIPDDSAFLDVGDESLAKKGELNTKPLAGRLKERRLLRSASVEASFYSVSFFTALRYGIAMSLKITYNKVVDFLKMFELWRGHFKEIEGSFGNGILSYFTFLKWLLNINIFIFILSLAFIVIPQAVHKRERPAFLVTAPLTNTSLNESRTPTPATVETEAQLDEWKLSSFLGANTSAFAWKKECHMKKPSGNYGNHHVGHLVSDFMQGVGWINTTLMYYGSFSSRILVMPTGSFYNMPLAYFTVSSLSFLLVLLLTLWSASSIIEDSYVKEGVKHYNSYCNKVFGGWDMCISDEEAAILKTKSFVNELEGDLAEDLRLTNLAKRTRNERIKIYLIRITINTIVILLSIGSGWAIYKAAQLSLKTAQATNPNAKESSKIEMISLLKSYTLPITLTLINSVLPNLFYFLSRLEDWNPRVRVNIDLARTILLKLASVAVLMVSLFQKIQTYCMLCWENAIAAEMYKLIWMDFFVVVAVVITVHTPRRYASERLDFGIKLGEKIGRPIFSIPQNVLELVYAQCLIWIGMWYSPMLTLMGTIKFFILFYVKKMTLKYNCRSEDKAYRAGKSNYFFMLLLLVTFFLCVAAVVYGITQVHPSLLYGPFRGLNRMYKIVYLTILTLPIGFQDLFQVVQSPVFVIVVVLLICLGLYFFYATAKVYYRMISELREELSMETKDKKFLLKRLTTST